MWINRGTNAPPTSGQSAPYSLYAYDAADRLSTLERRTDDGALVSQAFQYGMLDQMTAETQTETIGLNQYQSSREARYDVLGRRTSEWDSLRDGSNPANGEKAHWGPDGIFRQDAHDRGSDDYRLFDGMGHLLMNGDQSLEFLLYQCNATGSVPYMVDGGDRQANFMQYDAFGQMTPWPVNGTTDANPTPFAYEGAWGYQSPYHPTDGETGLDLYNVGMRQYDYHAGRFTTPDPIGLAGGLNRYLYADDDPING